LLTSAERMGRSTDLPESLGGSAEKTGSTRRVRIGGCHEYYHYLFHGFGNSVALSYCSNKIFRLLKHALDSHPSRHAISVVRRPQSTIRHWAIRCHCFIQIEYQIASNTRIDSTGWRGVQSNSKFRHRVMIWFSRY
jgi:hypothetical protein